MGDIVGIHTVADKGARIEFSRISRKLTPGSIAMAGTDDNVDVVVDHTAEPIKRLEDIDRVTDYLISEKRYRDNMLFICGINFGLRISDLLTLRFSTLINDDLSFKDEFQILEKKTSSTRKNKVNRTITINDAVVEAVTLFIQYNDCRLDDYLFKSESNRCTDNKPLSRMSVDRILKDIAHQCGLTCKVSSHTLRKTFGYHQMMMSGNDPRKLTLLQKIFGHSSSAITLKYIGLTDEEISSAYNELNLGSRYCYRSSSIGRSAVM